MRTSGFLILSACMIVGALSYASRTREGREEFYERLRNERPLAVADAKRLKEMNRQAEAIAAERDPQDSAALLAIREKIVVGAKKAKSWRPDARFYSYRRVFQTPENTPQADEILTQADSYYYESKSTQDNLEVLFDKTSKKILRIDVNAGRLPRYAENLPDFSRVRMGPKKALKIAMLTPTFQEFKKSQGQAGSQAVLNEVEQPADVSGYWSVTLFDGFDPKARMVQAFVNAETGAILSRETLVIIFRPRAR
jgi:hypothetical protein